VSHEVNLGEVEINLISLVPRGADRKQYFLVKSSPRWIQRLKLFVEQLLEEDTATKIKAKVARQIAKELIDQQVPKGVRGQSRRAAQPPVPSPGLFQTTSFIVMEFD
jgi:hypothetical protein